MEKQQLIQLIKEQVASGSLSKAELLHIANGQSTNPEHVGRASSKNLINVFYSIGAIIALVGVAILVAQNWNEIGFIGRIMVTLGIAFATYIAGLLLKNPEQRMISQVLFTLSAILAPLGSYVLLNEANIRFTLSTQVITAILLFVVYATALFISKKNILTLITIGFGTWAYYAAILNYFDFGLFSTSGEYLKWSTMLLGAAYLLIAYGYGSVANSYGTHNDKKAVQNVLYAFGTLAMLGAGISIGDAFDLVFILMIFAAFYGSVYLRSRAMLILASLFLAAHIIKLTNKYFIDSIGWPVALIFVGFLVIGIGYATFYLNRKFISTK